MPADLAANASLMDPRAWWPALVPLGLGASLILLRIARVQGKRKRAFDAEMRIWTKVVADPKYGQDFLKRNVQ
jgi:hypothetical protein